MSKFLFTIIYDSELRADKAKEYVVRKGYFVRLKSRQQVQLSLMLEIKGVEMEDKNLSPHLAAAVAKDRRRCQSVAEPFDLWSPVRLVLLLVFIGIVIKSILASH